MKAGGLVVLALLLVAAGFAYVVVTREPPESVGESRPVLWSVEAEELSMIAIDLPREALGRTWYAGDDHRWRFDSPDGRRVDPQRWGDGIPLLLDTPAAERLISEDPSDRQLAAYGLTEPSMRLDLATTGGTEVSAEIGDATPDGDSYYLRLAGESAVYTIHSSWFRVLERLVVDPPYP